MMTRLRAHANGLRCYVCGGGILAVKDSRHARNSVRRRRKCVVCRASFTTFEIMSPTRDDSHRLFAALDFYEQMAALPEAQRKVVLALLQALTPPKLALVSPPPDAGQLSLDAALVPPELEEAPFG
jgi:Transcriptional repressor NrdR-like, N-terminal domain